MDTELDFYKIGQRIRKKRTEEGLTQEVVAEAADVGVQHISAIENGKVSFSCKTLLKIARTLNSSVDYLVYDEIPYLVEQYDLDVKKVLEDCTPKERELLLSVLRETKAALRKFEK